AIYFKGRWLTPFKKERTGDEPFTPARGPAVKTPMMKAADDFAYGKGEGFAALQLPYAGRDVAMLLLLPDDAAGLGALEAKLTPELLAQTMGSLHSQHVDVWLPKFTLRYRRALIPDLRSMGIKAAFSDAADFSAMTRSAKLMIS